ncbi:DUF4129 domain-containing protein [Thermococcus prieurii]
MSTKVKFVALLTITVVLLAFVMNSHAFSAPHRRSTSELPLDFLTVVVLVGISAGLVFIIMMAFYFREFKGFKMRFDKEEGASSLLNSIVSAILSLIFIASLKLVGRPGPRPSPINCTLLNNVSYASSFSKCPVVMTSNLSNSTPSLSVNLSGIDSILGGLNTGFHCPITNATPLATSYGTSTARFSKSAVTSHLWIVFMLPVLLSFVYAGYHYYRLGRDEVRRKRKLQKAIEFDEKLDEFGLERFSDPKEAIVEIYKNAVLWLEGLGIPYRESWTHWEHAEHVKYMHEAFVKLARLFEKAKYAPERLEWKDAEKALEIYNELRGRARELAELE